MWQNKNVEHIIVREGIGKVLSLSINTVIKVCHQIQQCFERCHQSSGVIHQYLYILPENENYYNYHTDSSVVIIVDAEI